ncbi:MAG TPA: UDP-glucose 4-epimerase GalE [Flavobacteriales bacterium]|nr:UDP-glucose 4-epimerase GalE [Flavobacteriales bacterium]
MSKNKKILVTGGCGYIGSHTVVSLVENGYDPVIVDTLENSEAFIHANLEKITGRKIAFHQANCCDEHKMEELFGNENFCGIIHFAAYKAVGESVEFPLKYYSNNINSLLVMLKMCEKFRVSDFIFSSSCTVYGSPEKIPVTEQTPSGKAESPYGNTKVICEQIITDFTAANKWLRSILLRYFNPVGAHPGAMIGELGKGIPANLLPYITQTAKGIREVLTVFGNDYSTHDGTCIRDYIHVCDVANAHVQALEHIDNFVKYPEIFNLGSGNGNTVLEVIKTFEEVNGVKVNYRIGPRRSGDVEKIYANTQKAEQMLGWKCRYTLADTVKHAWNWENNLSTFKSLK